MYAGSVCTAYVFLKLSGNDFYHLTFPFIHIVDLVMRSLSFSISSSLDMSHWCEMCRIWVVFYLSDLGRLKSHRRTSRGNRSFEFRNNIHSFESVYCRFRLLRELQCFFGAFNWCNQWGDWEKGLPVRWKNWLWCEKRQDHREPITRCHKNLLVSAAIFLINRDNCVTACFANGIAIFGSVFVINRMKDPTNQT